MLQTLLPCFYEYIYTSSIGEADNGTFKARSKDTNRLSFGSGVAPIKIHLIDALRHSKLSASASSTEFFQPPDSDKAGQVKQHQSQSVPRGLLCTQVRSTVTCLFLVRSMLY